VIAALDAAARLAGGSVALGQADPCWQPTSTSRASPRRVYEHIFGEAAILTAVYACVVDELSTA